MKFLFGQPRAGSSNMIVFGLSRASKPASHRIAPSICRSVIFGMRTSEEEKVARSMPASAL